MYTHAHTHSVVARRTRVHTAGKRQQRARTRRCILRLPRVTGAGEHLRKDDGRRPRRAGLPDRVVQQVSPDGRPSRIRRLPRILTDARAASQHRRTLFTTFTGQSVFSICAELSAVSASPPLIPAYLLPLATRHFYRTCAVVERGAIFLGARFKYQITRFELYICIKRVIFL